MSLITISKQNFNRTLSTLTCLFALGLSSLAQSIAIDHVIVSVSDLEKSSRVFEKLGFKVKPGTLHKNGIINSHIKLSNESAVELISIQGSPGDELAKRYQTKILQGGGGTFIALRGIPFHKLATILNDLNIEFHWLKHPLWDYITFEAKELQNIFFINYHDPYTKKKAWVKHPNLVQAMTSVSMNYNESLRDLLNRLIAQEEVNLIDDSTLKLSFKTSTGTLILLKNGINKAPISSIEFITESGTSHLKISVESEERLLQN